jgi:hypothetical protein
LALVVMNSLFTADELAKSGQIFTHTEAFEPKSLEWKCPTSETFLQ